jgi:hypothetical protein
MSGKGIKSSSSTKIMAHKFSHQLDCLKENRKADCESFPIDIQDDLFSHPYAE